MIDFSQAVQAISDNGGFKSNAKDTSFYRVYTTQGSKPIQVRVSNHGTHLWTWYDRNYNPSASINICIVLSQNGENNTDTSVDMRIKDKQGNIIGERKPFEVTQYVYNCQTLNNNDAALINQAVLSIWRNGSFTDPLANTPKKALVQRLQPTPKQNTNNKETNENKIMNKKQVIRITEKQVKEIVKQVLREAVLPHYDTLAVDVDDDGNLTTARDNDGNEVMFKGEDMFPDDVLYTAEKLRKLTGNKLKITVSNSGLYRMFYSGSLSIDSLELIIKVAKYLRTDRVSLDGTTVTWSDNIDHDKSHKTQVGKKYFDTVPQEHQVTKPRVLHYGWELQPNVGVDMPEGGRGYAGSY